MINSYMWQKHTQVKLSQRTTIVQFEVFIKPDPTFIRSADERKTKQKRKQGFVY